MSPRGYGTDNSRGFRRGDGLAVEIRGNRADGRWRGAGRYLRTTVDGRRPVGNGVLVAGGRLRAATVDRRAAGGCGERRVVGGRAVKHVLRARRMRMRRTATRGGAGPRGDAANGAAVARAIR